MRILVRATSFMSSHVVRRQADAGHDVTVSDIRRRNRETDKNRSYPTC